MRMVPRPAGIQSIRYSVFGQTRGNYPVYLTLVRSRFKDDPVVGKPPVRFPLAVERIPNWGALMS